MGCLANEAIAGAWGVHWAYDAGDGKKPEKASKFFSLAYDGFCGPAYEDCGPDG
jgi:hypothetical protein